MSVIVFVDADNGKIKKSSLEAAFYASKLGANVTAVALGEIKDLESLGTCGVSKVLHASDVRLNSFDSKAYAKAIVEAANQENADTIVLAFNQNGKALGSRLAIRFEAGYIPGVSTVLENNKAKKSVFSGKAIAEYEILSDKKVLAISPNSFPIESKEGKASVESFTPSLDVADFTTTVKSREMVEGDIPLTEAERVVSAGRGLKGPENWGMIEECAKILGAATACSRAVADVDWRPHHEHVGQTGVAIAPNLYIAVGISGAIQHLAGVNQSKVMVVINIDPEAPFFKEADYGIVGDAFEVMPKFNEALKVYMANK